MDWKFRHDKQDNKDWHLRFFDHLRKKSGIFCDWRRPLHGIFDCKILFCLPVQVALVVPFVLWFAYAFPLACVIDFLAGDIIRGEIITKCDSSTVLVNETVQECLQRRERKAIESRFCLFASPLVLAFVSYFLMSLFPRIKTAFSFMITACGAIFGLLFLPWFFHDVLEFIPTWIKIVVILPSALLWCAFPVLRRNATLVLILKSN